MEALAMPLPRYLMSVTGAVGILWTVVAHPAAVAPPVRFLQTCWRRLLRRGEFAGVELSEHQRELLKGNDRLFNAKELELLKMLMEEGQRHVCGFWAVAGVNDAVKIALVHQLTAFDNDYPGGLRAYLRNAKRLLKASANGENPYTGYKVFLPKGVTMSMVEGPDTVRRYEEAGLEGAAHTAFVIVAGGLGERLGYNGIKVSLPSETATGLCFLGLYIHTILALEQRSGAPRALPLAIMTSDDTHAATAELLKKNAFFGASRSQITLIKQGKVPCLADPVGNVAMEAEQPYRVQEKPHGHGDVHALLARHGLARTWLARGFRWIAFFQDTNALVFRGLLPSLGVSVERQWAMNSLCVPRFAKENIGAICGLESPEGSTSILNVEYNQLDSLLRSDDYPEGDVNTPSGFSPFPGNINQLVIKLDAYAACLAATGGVIGEFVNPKYREGSRAAFKKPTRLESMMQDFPKSLPPSETVGFTTICEVAETYCPVKNAPADARAAAAKGAPTHSATQAELAVYHCFAAALRRAGVAVGAAPTVRFNGLRLKGGPQIVLHPSFAICSRELTSKIPTPGSVNISAASALVVRGRHVSIHQLTLDGALDITVEPGASLSIKSLTVANKGWQMVPVDEKSDAPEYLRIRGFTTTKAHGCSIHVKQGNVVLSASELGDVAITYNPVESRAEYGTDAASHSVR